MLGLLLADGVGLAGAGLFVAIGWLFEGAGDEDGFGEFDTFSVGSVTSALEAAAGVDLVEDAGEVALEPLSLIS